MPPLAPILAEELSMAGPSAVVLLLLFLLLAVTVTMFWSLIWRETTDRRSAAMAEWARANGFRVLPRGSPARPPVPLGRFEPGVRVVRMLDGRTKGAVVQFVVARPPAADEPAPATAPAAGPRRRHVLVWPVPADWPPVGLRPAHAADALVDLLALPVQLTEGTERFAVCTADKALGHRIGRSSARGLLPADVGMILLGRHLLLDFSGRPFDGIEFTRMIAVAEQVAAHLPEG